MAGIVRSGALGRRIAPLAAGWHGLPGNIRGTVLLLVSFVFFTFEIVGAKMLGERLPTAQVVFVRSIAQLIALLPFIYAAGLVVFRTAHLPLHVLRSTFGVVGLFCYFYSFGHLPLANATTLSFTKALFLTIAAWLILREQVGPHRWIATTIGLLGVLIVVRPGMAGFDAVSLVAILGAMTGAGLMTCTKLLTGRENTLSIMAYVAVITTALSIGPGLWFWQAPDRFELAWLIVIGVMGPIGQFFGISAFRAGDASVLAPIDYVRLLISVAVGLWLFAEHPDFWTGLGAAVIVMSTLFVNRVELQRARARSPVPRQPPGAPPL